MTIVLIHTTKSIRGYAMAVTLQNTSFHPVLHCTAAALTQHLAINLSLAALQQ